MQEKSPEACHSELRIYASVAGLLMTFLVTAFVAFFLLKQGAVRWPFSRVHDVPETYKNILFYLPVLFVALSSFAWMRWAGFAISNYFSIGKRSLFFFISLAISLGYAVYMLKFKGYLLRGLPFWPPVIILCLMNALSEETFYRLFCLSLLNKTIANPLVSNVLQSLLYTLPHIFIGGAQLAVLAFGFGILMGEIMRKDKNVLACMVCHFIVNLGSIGLPLLIFRPAG